MKKVIAGLISLSLVMSVMLPTATAAEKENKTEVMFAENASSAIVMERDTGEILYEHNSEESLPPASMTKIMTMLLIMEAIDKEQLKYEDMIRVSENAASMGGSQIFLEPGEEMSVQDMLKGIAVASGNDASVAMAEHLGGTEAGFSEMMNEKAEELGLKKTHFSNSNGLPVDNHYTSAHDLAIMAKELLKYEDITKFTGIYEDYLRSDTEKPFWLVNTNKLVRFYPGVDGLKTGYTKEAKYGLTATAEKDGMRIIAVVMGSPSPKERNADVTSMLDYAFSQFTTHKLHERNDLIAEVKVSKGQKKNANAVTGESVSILTKKGESTDEVKETVELVEDVKAPIQKGDELGTLIIKNGDTVVSETPLVADEEMMEASWWTLFKRVLGGFGGN
ncbi:D-alanyl-D-alanine carboxypeptidase family protein [Alkalicoccobacillus murimartini]|uniref:serine-type D-Ala-D-Ala carboxypeptidase n=1 Tax=Alkalicoccobacillus murimartini TaxID=171685 RepID=A0ABT9YD61_9BACI|nr:D-alanyl-D-alanine carboxypeptidase family protein [Alkalicoccobacillus murimartini]MDQ0205795.1 D-alanyl-D-alanine carboxypeptidase (penicillin-binding protein 5/6) [Alkalicoccobacillus murimartini]